MTPSSATTGWGTIRKDASVDGAPLTLNGVTYRKGLGTHAVSEILYTLSGNCSRFLAVVGVDDEVTLGSIRFQVFADNVLLYDSARVVGGNLTGSHPGQPVSVDVSGRQALRLLVTDGGNGIGKDHADWADARLTCAAIPPEQPAVTSYLSDVAETSASIGWGRLGKDISVNGTPLGLNGVTYAKGLGTHAISDIRYTVAGRC